MLCTSWNVFEDSSADSNETTEAILGYIDFCLGAVIPTKTSRVYPNNKLWVTKGLKEVLSEKKRGFASGFLQDRKEIQRKVNKEIYKAKCQYGDKVQRTLTKGNARAAWTGIKTIANAPFKGGKKIDPCPDERERLSLANKLN